MKGKLGVLVDLDFEVKTLNKTFLLDHATSSRMSAETPTNTWTELSATGTVPENTAVMQAVITQWQCNPDEGADTSGNCWDGNGGVYFDDLSFTVSE